MSWFSNADDVQLWAVALCIAVMFAACALIAIVVFAWNHRPVRKDAAQQDQLRRRLAEISMPVQPRKSA
ncbi:MAG TPA: hypothetical protein VL240_01535 [Candidatus Binatia bacterium]|nr:hypothetical protein [Candidatus Binatia bacterium]